MSVLVPGANAVVPTSRAIVSISMHPVSGVDVDVSAFLLKSNGKVRNDDDMCFYGQPAVAGGSVTLASSSHGKTEFHIDLPSVDAVIEKIALTATIHENKTRFASFLDISIDIDGVKALVPTINRTETALILGEFYRRNSEWKFRCVGQGFEGGLAPLATHFGVVIDDAPKAVPSPPASPSGTTRGLAR